MSQACQTQTSMLAVLHCAPASMAAQSTFPSTLLFRPVEAHGRERLKSGWPKTRAAPDQSRRLCLGGEMSGDALLATPERPLYEPSHRPPKITNLPKKRSARSRSFCSDNTITDDQHTTHVHSGPTIFWDLGLIAAVTACPTPSGHKVRRIATDTRRRPDV